MQAAWPTIRSPSFNNEGLGIHPDSRRALSSSVALGGRLHTATAVTPPIHVVS